LSDSTTIGNLHELIDALDRRRPQPNRADEAGIARDSAALRIRALARLAELEPGSIRCPSAGAP
jgi:hypothetical protein